MPIENLTKRAIQLPPANHNPLPIQDFVPSIPRSTHASWQSRWDQCAADGNTLVQLKPSLGPWSFCSQLCRRLEVSSSCLRISHNHLTQTHLVACEALTVCNRFQVRLSVFHVLVEFCAP